MVRLIAIVCSILGIASSVVADPVTLVENGKARCSIVLLADSAFDQPAAFDWSPRTPLLQWAADDLASYLHAMTGADIQVSDKPIEGLVPIYVAQAGVKYTPAQPTEFGDAYLLDVDASRIILQGESRRAVYYAAAQLLSDLGVRWYAPGDIGQVVPKRKTVTIEAGRRAFAPDFVTRRLWCAGAEQTRWMYRNRLSEATIPAGHSLHAFGAALPGWRDGREGRAEHPDFYNVHEGKPSGWINLANRDIPAIFAKRAVELVETGPRSGAPGGKVARGMFSLSPDDGYLRDERPEVIAMNHGQIDPLLKLPSFSNAWFDFLSRVCDAIDTASPGLDYRIGSLAYMNYIMPPDAKPNEHIIPVIAPITFNRYVSMGIKGAPASELLEEVVRGWTAKSPRVGMYLYNFNLADMAMPYTRTLHWRNDVPRLRAMGVRDMTIESHPNWHTMMPGNYVVATLLWDSDADIDALLDEYYPLYFGPAAKHMRQYDHTLEQAYETTRVFAGGAWATHAILTPDIMSQLDAALTEAERATRDQGVYADRVDVSRHSLNFAKHWLAAREAMHAARFVEAEDHARAFVANYKQGFDRFPLFFGPNRSWSPNIERYFELFHMPALTQAGAMEREGRVLHVFADTWSTHLERLEGNAQPSAEQPARDTDNWQPLKTYSATLDEQGLSLFRGKLWYRQSFALDGAKVNNGRIMLWLGGADSRARVWVNDVDLGEHRSGSFAPISLDVTDAVKPGNANNDLLIAVDNRFPNEIGTGGLLRPVILYRAAAVE
jgi:hypothetical protein